MCDGCLRRVIQDLFQHVQYNKYSTMLAQVFQVSKVPQLDFHIIRNMREVRVRDNGDHDFPNSCLFFETLKVLFCLFYIYIYIYCRHHGQE